MVRLERMVRLAFLVYLMLGGGGGGGGASLSISPSLPPVSPLSLHAFGSCWLGDDMAIGHVHVCGWRLQE